VNPRAQQTAAQLRSARVLGLRKRRRRIPRQLPPTMVWRAYATALLELYGRVRAAFAPLRAELPALVAGVAAERARHLDAGENLTTTIRHYVAFSGAGKTIVEARDGDRVVATAEFTHRGTTLYPEFVTVDPELRRQGLATRMYALAERDTGKLVVAGELQTTEGMAFSQTYRSETRRARELLDQAATTMRAAVRPAVIEDLAAQMGERTSQHQRRQLEKQARAALGVDPYIREPGLRDRLETFSQENAQLIDGLAEETRAQIANIVMRGLSTGRTADDLGEEIDQRFALGERRCKRIARDQVGSLNGQLSRLRNEALGVTAYIWRTMRDRRVRGDPDGAYPKADPSHYDREGKRFTYTDPPEGGHPGADYECRCYEEPDFSDILGEG